MRLSALAAAMLVGLAAPVAASPCANNNWQPTFVHDLENEDGPWFVTSSMGFVQLRWVQNGGYVPHACELVPNERFTRNPRGWTNCQQYTRVQCGCSRSIPGNDTCAAFLRVHTARVTPPGTPPGGGGTAGGGGTSGSGGMSGMPGGSGTPGVSGATINLPGTAFQRLAQYNGTVTPQGSGVVLGGGAWTNGRLKNGIYDGNRVRSSEAYDFGAGGDAYMTIIPNGAGKYMAFYPRVLEGISVKHMSTGNSWAGSVVVKDNERLFAHVSVQPGGTYRLTVARSAYDDRGGQVIFSANGQLANRNAHLELQFVDNYAGAAAQVAIAETVVRTGAPARTGGTPPSPPRSGPTGGAGSCSKDSDCPGSICLLGVCAPPSRR